MAETITRRPHVDADWADLAAQFDVRKDTIYLNQGSFGISPRIVRQARRRWIDELDCQPMDFYVREFEPLLAKTLDQLAQFLNTVKESLIFVENATTGMNIVADNFPLNAGDQVLSNNHEYGAVHRIWDRACERADAQHRIARLPDIFESHEQVVEAVFAEVNEHTRLIIVSHITSATALIMPVQAICDRAGEMGIPVCIDGPHAPAHVPLDLTELNCALYTSSCHKWLCATLGSGFLYVHPEFQHQIQPPVKSWGRLLPAMPEEWFEEFIWPGTRDPSSFLSVGTAMDFMQSVGLSAFRDRTYTMARQTAADLMELTGTVPLGRDPIFYGTMAHVPLPEGDWSQFQMKLWQEAGIEVPIITFENRYFVRVSHHLYTTRAHCDTLLGEISKALV